MVLKKQVPDKNMPLQRWHGGFFVLVIVSLLLVLLFHFPHQSIDALFGGKAIQLIQKANTFGSSTLNLQNQSDPSQVSRPNRDKSVTKESSDGDKDGAFYNYNVKGLNFTRNEGNAGVDKADVGEAIGKGEDYGDYNCTVDFVATTFLVKESSMETKNGTMDTLRLDLMDDVTAPMYQDADIIVFNTGHWWTHEKTSKGGGQWNSGGRCHEETKPIFEDYYLQPYPTKMTILEQVVDQMKNTHVMFMNISKLTDYRKDAHPSIYRKHYKTEAEKLYAVKSQDCSHWCLPGVPDAWNELLYASLLRRGKGSWRKQSSL
ncbi:hypothetical protein Sjap_016145 [Stephania japonica]|uniref:Trichome birefringence-like C-terminal domain-containing protein n=1 Tax=Stephania japonica TaxID=461633 RepID=A0AAP0ILM1_9MAGN